MVDALLCHVSETDRVPWGDLSSISPYRGRRALRGQRAAALRTTAVQRRRGSRHVCDEGGGPLIVSRTATCTLI